MSRHGSSLPLSRRRGASSRTLALLFVTLIALSSADGILQVEAQRLQQQRTQTVRFSPSQPNVITPTSRNQAAPPSGYSGAYPSYPLNHTLDAYPQILQDGPTNWDFETPSTPVGTPPPNFDFESPRTDLDLPTNFDFATGDFSGWTVTGAATIESTGGPDGSYAKVPPTTGSWIITDAFTVSAEADAFVFDHKAANAIDYVYVLSGPGFATSTELGSIYCGSSCSWTEQSFAATTWRGQTIKLKFDPSFGSIYLDRVRTVDLASGGWDFKGAPQTVVRSGDTWMENIAEIITPPIAIDQATQYLTFNVLNPSTTGSTPQGEVFVLTGPTFGTSTKIGYFAVASTLTVKVPVVAWQGQSIRLRITDAYGFFGIDDIGQQEISLPAWTVASQRLNRILHPPYDTGITLQAGPLGADGYDPGQTLLLPGSDDVVSPPITVPTNGQQLLLMHRAPGAQTSLSVKVLSGAGYGTVTDLTPLPVASPTADWGWLALPISAFAGQTIKLRLHTNSRLYLNDVGFIGRVAPGWDLQTGSSAITVRYDTINGTYLQAEDTTKGFTVTSSTVSAGIVDPTGSAIAGRSVALGYQFGPSAGSTITVQWIPVVGGVAQPGSATQAYFAAAASSSDTAYKDARFMLHAYQLPLDANGERIQTGYYKISGAAGTRLYQIADNLARQQRSEPFTMPVGAGIDAVTGSFNWTETDLTLAGGPLPLVLTRYYAGHSDRLGPLGYRWRHSFDTQLYIGAGQTTVAILFADGREEAFEWDAVAAAYTAVDSRVHSTLTKTVVGGITTFSYATTNLLTYEFNDKGQLIHVVDPNANTLDFVYDASDRLSTVTTVGGRTLTFSYTGSQLTQVTGPDSLVVTYTYNTNGDLVAVDKPDAQRSEYTYSRHRLRHLYQKVQAGPDQPAVMQEVAANKLDDYNRVTRQTDASGVDIQVKYQYDWTNATVAAGVTSVKDRSSAGAITRYDFDHYGRITYVTSPMGVVTQFLFDAEGNLEKWIDGNNGEYSFSYDSNGDLSGVTDPLNNVRNITVNGQHLPTEVDDGTGHITKNTYDANGNLTRSVVDYGSDPANLNLTTDFEYDSAGNRTAVVVDPDDGVGDPEVNLRTEWTYNSDGLPITKTIDPDDGVGDPELDLTWEYAYTSRGQLLVEVDPSGLRKRYTYTAFGRIETTIVDPTNDPTGTPYAVDPGVVPLNLTSRYVFDFGGKLVVTMDPICTAEFIDPRDCQSEWFYDERGLVTDKYDAMDVRTHYAYDDTGQMTDVTQDATMPIPLGTELNRTTHYEYDADGRLSRVIVDPDDGVGDPELNLVTEYHYDPAGRLEQEIVDPADLALTTAYHYDAKGRLAAKQTPGMSGTDGWSYTYDNADRLETTTDPMGRVTKNVYDGAGRLIQTIVDPYADPQNPGTELNLTTTYVYDAANRLIKTIGPDGLITATEYDAASRTIRTTIDPDDGVGDPELNLATEYAYYPNGALWTTTDPEGHVTERAYDRAGRLVAVTAPGNRTTAYEYDRNSRLIRQTSPSGVVTAFAYDLMGRRTTTVVDPYADPQSPAGELNLTSTVTYDRLGRQIAVENPRGNGSNTDYDAAGRVVRLTDDLHPVAGLAFAYDAAGRTTDVTDPLGSVTHTTYSDAGNPLATTIGFGTASAQTWTREYDLSGAMTRQLDPNTNDLRYSYDRAGRLSEIWTPGTPNVTYASYSYDAAGRTTGITNYNGTVGYQYDAVGRVEQVSSPEGTVSYTYNAIGQRTSMTLPGSRTVSYGYDATTADLATITDWSTAPAPMAFTFTNDGQLESVTRPTGTGTPAEAIVSTYGYDTAGRLDAISHAQNGSYLAEYGYTLDATGNRERIDITGSAVASGYEEHTYDALDRVDYARYVDGGTATFTYDANGNRDTVTAGGVTTTFAYDDLGQLVGITDNSAAPLDLAIAYDANGNRRTVTDTTTSTVTREYSWDWANRLTEADVNGVTTDYTYLGDDTRQNRTTSSGTTDYLYDRAGGLPQVVDDGTNGYLHDVTGNLVSIDGSGTPTYPLQDGLGSVRLSLDDSGSVLGTSEWDAWGTLRSSTGSSYGFGWAGEQFDSSSDLVYLRARSYSPGTASFLSRDTIQPSAGGTTGYNPYAYANGNPVTFTDPTGHMPSVADFGGGIAGVFMLLAYIFECFLSGNCFYLSEWGDSFVGELVHGVLSAASVAAMAIKYGLKYLIENWPSDILSRTGPGPGLDWQDTCLYCPIIDPIIDKGRELLPKVFGACVGGEVVAFVFELFATYCRVFDTSGEFAYSATISTLPNYQFGVPYGISADVDIIVSNADSVWDLEGCSGYAGISAAPDYPFESMIMIEHGENGYGYTFEAGLVGGLDTGVEVGNACTWVSSDWSFGSLDYVKRKVDAAVHQVSGCLLENYARPWNCVR